MGHWGLSADESVPFRRQYGLFQLAVRHVGAFGGTPGSMLKGLLFGGNCDDQEDVAPAAGGVRHCSW